MSLCFCGSLFLFRRQQQNWRELKIPGGRKKEIISIPINLQSTTDNIAIVINSNNDSKNNNRVIFMVKITIVDSFF